MSQSSIFGYTVAAGLMLASAGAAAEPAAATPSTSAPARKTTLGRASDDVLRQLRPSGLKRNAQGFGAVAKRGYQDVASKVTGKAAKR